MQASSVVWFAFFLALATPFIIMIVAILTKDSDHKVSGGGDLPNYKAQHENYWREYIDK